MFRLQKKIREIPKDFPLLYWFIMKKNKGNPEGLPLVYYSAYSIVGALMSTGFLLSV